ncbi:hypothetical protein FGE12_29420 [Aggregicoccus sp. 17bor-14]|uniref:hypothetical protein n=1 Tax=Myxococcaceae TaxID=31 RepID=UPI00129D21DB|nr:MULTISPECIES: hypothetical protein [Myxococcaceae]MBF5046573.1 hypothetical protein [Simulacricoccus sp. 17bor-14]MRI92284.1 hypothetical protein [Aggregicoccus sp. 17bor-14]
MQLDFTRPFVATHVIHTRDPSLEREAVMLCADARGNGPAFTREEWEQAQSEGELPTPVWTCRDGRWFALGTAARVHEGKLSFWAVPVQERAP